KQHRRRPVKGEGEEQSEAAGAGPSAKIESEGQHLETDRGGLTGRVHRRDHDEHGDGDEQSEPGQLLTAGVGDEAGRENRRAGEIDEGDAEVEPGSVPASAVALTPSGSATGSSGGFQRPRIVTRTALLEPR